MNDTAQDQYTNATVLPYYNLALMELQEIFELNDIPVTHKTSAVISVPSGIRFIGFDTNPALPSDVVEIEQLWESFSGQNQWVPVGKRDFIPHSLEDNVPITQFLIWAWKNANIEVIPTIGIIDLKIDYIGSIFNLPVLIKDIDVNIPAVNTETYLGYKTASLCAMFIAENENRSGSLDNLAISALSRALGIPIKGMQTVVTRRRPFRAAYKQRGSSF